MEDGARRRREEGGESEGWGKGWWKNKKEVGWLGLSREMRGERGRGEA